MAWEIYDNDAFVDYFGPTNNITLLRKLKNEAIDDFLNNAASREGADEKLTAAFIEELSLTVHAEEWQWLIDIVEKATPPIRLANGTEDWLTELYPNEEWEEPISDPNDPRIKEMEPGSDFWK